MQQKGKMQGRSPPSLQPDRVWNPYLLESAGAAAMLTKQHSSTGPSSTGCQDLMLLLWCAGIEEKIKSLAAKRNMKDGTIGPVITWTTEGMLGHVDKLLQIPGG